MDYLGISRSDASPVVSALNKLLCDYQVYYQNLRNFHWNVSGVHFFDLHNKFEDLYNQAKTDIDDIAERVLTLRFRPISTLSQYLNLSTIDEAGTRVFDRDMVSIILHNQIELIKSMREVLSQAAAENDEGTIDLIGSKLEATEKSSWMLDAWLSPVRETIEKVEA
ncbi:MAG: DNA starvation/stationary phase protection protein [Bacteroidota bacterium]